MGGVGEITSSLYRARPITPNTDARLMGADRPTERLECRWQKSAVKYKMENDESLLVLPYYVVNKDEYTQ